jgi:DNA-binding transcriptional MocR family regulator
MSAPEQVPIVSDPASDSIQTLGGPLSTTLYEQIAGRILGGIRDGTLVPGQRIPSVRRASEQFAVSVTTVLEAYRRLEDRGVIEARPQSGYYVRRAPDPPPAPARTATNERAATLTISDLVLRVIHDWRAPGLLANFGTAAPSPGVVAANGLDRMLTRAVRRQSRAALGYDTPAGLEELRVQIARRALDVGVTLAPDDVVTTCGGQNAVRLCLEAVTRPGDTVVIETPTYFGLLEVLESLHLRALEVATFPAEGICLDALEDAMLRHRVAACVLCPTYGNPLGQCMPDEKKKRLAALLERAGVPLVEDDVYGDLSFDARRPPPVKAFDATGNVLLCSSFSKTLAPGFRVGWAAPGRYRRAVERLKFNSMLAVPTVTQLAVAGFLEEGGYDRHLRRLRRACADLVARLSDAISRSFPPGTRVSRPRGGCVLWVEMPPGFDALRLYDQARAAGIAIAPGPIFSATERYENCFRLAASTPWTPAVERALVLLAELVHAQMPVARA